eukprot:scaffold13337_cov62-Phaeocystis_antarctica.AAC.1
MFEVRSTRALAPQPSAGALPVHAACAAAAQRHSHLPAHTSPRIVCPPFDSAERGGVQPAAELRHVQRHTHGPHVLRALRACPGRPLPSAGPHFAPHRMPSFRLGSTRR